MIHRIYVEKKKGLSPAEDKLRDDIFIMLGIKPTALRKILRYDIENITAEDLKLSLYSVFAESPVDVVYEAIDDITLGKKVIILEYLAGQFDQRADSAMQCVQLLNMKERPLIRCATIYVLDGVTNDELSRIKNYLINPVESTEGKTELPETLVNKSVYEFKPDIIKGFIGYSDAELAKFFGAFGFAMAMEDLRFVRDYFKKIGRDPSLTELKVIDTYWSDHCRHTTFLTELRDIQVYSNITELEKTLNDYKKLFSELYVNRPDKYKCLMDVATIAVKKLKKDGYLNNLDESDEINACSVVVNVDIDGKDEEWLIMFKNETHNHPTEIEPFGGAATCLGGAIRDPLSGRVYVYQAMRVTGAADPRESIENTLKGKLPQRVITKNAASGFSSYGNQIGLATGMVTEIYHEGYKAKRLETGYVIGGAPKANVVRTQPESGDIVILLGGATGRDGCGGATGSSKSHTAKSVELCGAEVQKGNAPEERKIQRLFRNADLSKKIIKCNDFGAGGVCVAIGELAESLDIILDLVPKKYNGLTPTEIAISESQERMAIVVKKEDVNFVISAAKVENLKATAVAEITDSGRLRMFYLGNVVVDIERKFLDTNGVKQVRNVVIYDDYNGYFDKISDSIVSKLAAEDYKGAIMEELSKLNVCSKKGLSENFDSTIGAASVLMPFGGKNQITPAFAMASKPPVNGYTTTVTVSSSAYYPYLMSESRFVGAIYSVIGSVSKLIAAGVDYSTIRLTFQEFFMRLGTSDERWGSPLSALLGAFNAQMNMKLGAIGGKDSMSGSFEKLDVPPTLISFAMGIAKEKNIRHNAFDKLGKVYRVEVKKNCGGMPDFEDLLKKYAFISEQIQNNTIKSAAVVEDGGAICALAKSLFANDFGMNLRDSKLCDDMFKPAYGDILIVADEMSSEYATLIGELTSDGVIKCGNKVISVAELKKAFIDPLEKVFASEKQPKDISCENVNYVTRETYKANIAVAKPRVFIPVFPGTNCEYDTAKAFEMNGAIADIFVVKNYSQDAIADSVREMCKRIENSQIIAFPGGFSGGDEPDGSGKFIATTFKNPLLREAVLNMLYKRDGLAVGICNGFQALIKLGLTPYGKIVDQDNFAPTLSFNNIYRHVSCISSIRISSNKSPWLSSLKVGEVYNVPISHGEGKIIISEKDYKLLSANGQIATQYVDLSGNATMESPFNPNGSYMGIEGLLSPDGRVFGKMGHTERYRKNLYKNIVGNFDMNIFENGVKYFK